jgi:hypothetical protein
MGGGCCWGWGWGWSFVDWIASLHIALDLEHCF